MNLNNSVYILLLLLFLVASCKENNFEPLNSEIQELNVFVNENISLKDGYLVFNTIAYYEDLVNNVSFENKRKLLDKIAQVENFMSMNKYQENTARANDKLFSQNSKGSGDTIDGNFLDAILNKDGVVRIGEYIFKVEMPIQRVLVLHKDNENNYADLLQGNLTNRQIMRFSTHDDVLELLKEGVKGTDTQAKNNPEQTGSAPQLNLFCSEPGATRNKVESNIYISDAHRLDCKAVYQESGIYFSLQAKVREEVNAFGTGWALYGTCPTVEVETLYKPKCRAEQYLHDFRTECGGEANYRAYESTRSLAKYAFWARFYAANILTDWFFITDNY